MPDIAITRERDIEKTGDIYDRWRLSNDPYFYKNCPFCQMIIKDGKGAVRLRAGTFNIQRIA